MFSSELPIYINKIVTNNKINVPITYVAFTESTIPRALLFFYVKERNVIIFFSTVKLKQVLTNNQVKNNSDRKNQTDHVLIYMTVCNLLSVASGLS